MNLSILPKVELHVHLDCSLSYAVVQQLNPEITLADYTEGFIAPPKCKDLADFLRRAVRGFQLMQTREQLRLVTLDLFEQLKADSVIYAEIRFAPLLHTMQGLTPEEVVETVCEAVEAGRKKYDIPAGLILCTLRKYNEAQSLETAKLAQKYRGKNVVGFDLADDEAGFPIDEHIKAFQIARAHGIPCTAHAGEAKGPESVWETLEHFQPTRIGHGVRSVEDDRLVETLKRKNIHLEICPTSNIQVDVFDQIEDHPVDRLFNAGVSLSINTDTRTISNTTLNKEYELLHRVFNWKKAHFKKCNLAAIEQAFAPAKLKEKIKLQINKAY